MKNVRTQSTVIRYCYRHCQLKRGHLIIDDILTPFQKPKFGSKSNKIGSTAKKIYLPDLWKMTDGRRMLDLNSKDLERCKNGPKSSKIYPDNKSNYSKIAQVNLSKLEHENKAVLQIYL